MNRFISASLAISSACTALAAIRAGVPEPELLYYVLSGSVVALGIIIVSLLYEIFTPPWL
jgi:hypothetical protein